MRGTFANIRIRNEMVPGVEGGMTKHLPDGKVMPIYDAAMQYQNEGVPLVIVAGKEYGTGSSRDWAAKGTRLLGVKAVIVESFERIHRSNLVGMGVLPLQFKDGHDPPEPEARRQRALRHRRASRRASSRAPSSPCTITRADGKVGDRCRSSAASTRWTSWNISATAASCNTCSAT